MKVIFLQYFLDSYGGIETVNNILTKKMNEDNIDINLFCLRETNANQNIDFYKNIKRYITSKFYPRPSYKRMLKSFLKFKIKDFLSEFKGFLNYLIHGVTDYIDMKKKITKEDFNYIVVSNHQLIRCIPKDKLNKVIMHMHTGIDYYINNKRLLKKLLKYNNKIYKFVWLTNNMCEKAKKLGFSNSIYINNPVKFKTKEISKLDNNKLVYIGRLSEEKRVDKLIKIFNLASKENKNIKLDIYGTGYLLNNIKKLINEIGNKNIKYCGSTNNTEKVLLNASMLALTSKYEGLSMVCLEAYECGVPVIAFDFGPSTEETIINSKTGYIIEKENDIEYKNKLLEYFSIKDKEIFSKQTKKFAEQFEINNIIKEWYKILK